VGIVVGRVVGGGGAPVGRAGARRGGFLRADRAGPADDDDLQGLPSRQAVSIPRGPVPTERRRRRLPHGRRTGTTGEWPPATRGSPRAPAEDGPGRGLPPRGRVRSRCTSRGARTPPH